MRNTANWMKTVEKVNASGEVVAIYRSSADASAENYICSRTIRDYCNGTHKKSKCAIDGFIYRWGADRVRKPKKYMYSKS